MSAEKKRHKTDAEVVQALFERFGPEDKYLSWQLITKDHELLGCELPYYHTIAREPWSPLHYLDDLAPALLTTLREPERAARLLNLLDNNKYLPLKILFDKFSFFISTSDHEVVQEFYKGMWLSLTILADPETRPLVARAIVAAWED